MKKILLLIVLISFNFTACEVSDDVQRDIIPVGTYMEDMAGTPVTYTFKENGKVTVHDTNEDIIDADYIYDKNNCSLKIIEYENYFTTYHYVLVVEEGNETYLLLDAMKRISGNFDQVIGSYETGMSMSTAGNVIDSRMVFTYKSDNTWFSTVYITDEDEIVSDNYDWDPSTLLTPFGYTSVIIGGNQYYYDLQYGYKKQ